MENIELVTKEHCIKILEAKDFEGRCTYINAVINDERVDPEIIHIWTEALDEVNSKEDEKVVELLNDYRENVFTPKYGYYGTEARKEEEEEEIREAAIEEASTYGKTP